MALFNGENVYPLVAQFMPFNPGPASPQGVSEGGMWYDFSSKQYKGIVNGIITPFGALAGLNGTTNPPGGAGQCLPGQNFTNTTTGAFFDCVGTTWNLVTGGGALTIANLNGLLINALDCTQPSFAGANFGATINNCIAAAPAHSVITLANFNAANPGTISTAVNVNKAIIVYSGGLQIRADATITLSASGAHWIGNPEVPGDVNGGQSKVFNILAVTDQFVLSSVYTSVQNMIISGSGIATNGITISAGGGAPANISIVNNTFDNHLGSSLRNTTAQDTLISGNIFTRYGVSAIVLAGAGGQHRIFNNTVLNTTGSTGPVFNITNSGNTWLDKNVITNLAATDGVVINTAAEVKITDNIINQNGASSRIGINATTGNPLLRLKGNSVFGGPGFPALSAQTATLIASLNTFSSSGVTDTVLLGTNQGPVTFIENKVGGNAGSGQGASCIHLKGDSIGAIISRNTTKMTASAPTGNNYGIWLDTSSGGHFLGHLIDGNNLTANASVSFDVGIFYDNTSNLTSASPSIINNTCIDVTPAKCILRSDINNLNALYLVHNGGNNGATYSLAGSTLDSLIDYNIVFANLPNAGVLSKVWCSDCTPITPTTASGTGALITKTSAGLWQGGPALTGPCLLTSAVSPLACIAQDNGTVAVPATTTTYTINTTRMLANSRVFIVPTQDNAGIPGAPTCAVPAQPFAIQTARVAGTSFTFSLPSNAGITCFTWWILQ